MFSAGCRVLHSEYGIGRFQGVFGSEARVATVDFESRGLRRFVLPTTSLIVLHGGRRRNASSRSVHIDHVPDSPVRQEITARCAHHV